MSMINFMKEVLIAAIITAFFLGSSPVIASPAEAIALGDDVLAEDFPPLPKRKPIPITPPKPGKKPMTPAELDRLAREVENARDDVQTLEDIKDLIRLRGGPVLFMFFFSIDQYLGRGGGMI
jgi:hypothetical protein